MGAGRSGFTAPSGWLIPSSSNSPRLLLESRVHTSPMQMGFHEDQGDNPQKHKWMLAVTVHRPRFTEWTTAGEQTRQDVKGTDLPSASTWVIPGDFSQPSSFNRWGDTGWILSGHHCSGWTLPCWGRGAALFPRGRFSRGPGLHPAESRGTLPDVTTKKILDAIKCNLEGMLPQSWDPLKQSNLSKADENRARARV